MSPQESRALLASLRQRAQAAGLRAALVKVDVILGVAAQDAIAILTDALSTSSGMAAALANPPPVKAPSITPPRMPSMPKREPVLEPIALGRPDIVIDVGRHQTPQRTSVLAGLKKPEAKAPDGPVERTIPKAPRQPPKMTGWDPSDDLIPL